MRFLRQHGRQYTVYALYIIAFTLIQVTLAGWLIRPDYMPDLALVLVIVSGYYFGKDDGLIIGLAAGFLRDMTAGRFLGLGMLLLMLAGLTASSLLINFFQRNALLVLLQIVIISFVYELVLVFLTWLFPMLPDQVYSIRQLLEISLPGIIPGLVANAAAGLPILFLLRFLGPYARGSGQVDSENDETGDHVWRMT